MKVCDDDDWDAAALSASCVFTLRLHVFRRRNYNWLFSLMSASYLGLRSSAAMSDG